jgi:type IV pilus assembly protein PilB
MPGTAPILPANNSDFTDQVVPSQTHDRSTLVGILLIDGYLNQDQANNLLQEQIISGKSTEELLLEKMMVSEEVLVKAKAEVNGIPFIKIAETGISPEALSLIDESVAKRYRILPFSLDKQNNLLKIAMEDPLDLAALDFVEQKSGLRLEPHFAMPSELERNIAERYAQNLSVEVTEALQQAPQVEEKQMRQQDLTVLNNSVVRDAPINKIVETILEFAIKARASDVHIEPQLGKTRVRYRIDGILMEKLILPQSVHDAVVSRIKILTKLKIDERRVPQDGRFNYATQTQEVDLRVSTLPTIHGEKIVMRLLKKDESVPTLDELGMSGLGLKNVKQAIQVPHGIVLVTGPTGSGKTTTLYSILHLINTPKVNIMTLEDPVEYQMIGVKSSSG